MLTLNDGRSELWQWDTGRRLTVDADCTQVHFSNKFFGRSVDVDVFDGTAEIPDVLLQVDKDLLVWAFVGTAENGYTKISKVFKVNKRNKPADYVFTPTEQTTIDEIMKRLDRIEEGQDPDAIKNAVDEYLANNPIQIDETDPTVPEWAKQPVKPEYTAEEVGAVATVNGTAPDGNGNVEIEIPEAGGTVTDEQIAEAVEEYFSENPVKGVSSVVANVTDHGISTEAEDNTPALQALIDNLSSNGGGIIFFPVGTYRFKKTDTKYAVIMKSNVSIVGENIETTILKQTEAVPYSLFYRMGTANDALTGCSFSNFTVDAYSTGDANAVYGKAFFFQYLKDCVFRDIRLLGTVATAMGIDYLDRVTIDGIFCVDCGRTYAGQSGTSGIGIGTGGWENENFTITNCVCVGSGQFGIFIENQHLLGWGGHVDYSKGCIISNCVVRNGLNHGIGIRGGENVTIIGCETYENAKHGIYLDKKCKNVRIMSCSATANGRDGVHINSDSDSSRITVKGCVSVDNAENGIYVYSQSDKLCVCETYTDGNVVGLMMGAWTYNDCVIYNNVFLDGDAVGGSFEGITDYNQFINTVQPVEITAEALEVSVGERVKVPYSVFPSNANKNIILSSSNSNIASVTSNGYVVGVAEGACKITITSELNPDVSVEVDCTVAESESTPDVYEFSQTGYKLDETGAEVAASGAGITEYIPVTTNMYRFDLNNFILATGARVAFYDADKVVIDTKAIYSSGEIKEKSFREFVNGDSVAYVRVSINTINSSTVTIQRVPYDFQIVGSDFTNGLKINPDGIATTNETNCSGTDFVELGDYGDATTIAFCVIGQTFTTSGTRLRFAQYDKNKISLGTNFGMVAPAEGVPHNVTILDGVKYIRVGSVVGTVEPDLILYAYYT